MKTCVIFNPAARGEKAKQFREHLAALSARVQLKPTYAAGTGRELAAQAVQEGHEVVVAAGGDGTLNEVLNGIGDVPGGYERVRLGVLPLGTINVFARELGLPMGFEEAWRLIEQGRERLVDLPWAEFNQAGQACRRHFAQLAGAGLDSRAIELVDWEQKKALGPLAYVVAGLKALTEPKAQITVASGSNNVTGELVLVGNGRYYGGTFELFPQGNLQDGLLDVTVFPRVNWEVLFRTGWGWLTDQIHRAAGCHTFQAEAFSLSSDRTVPFELDGENVGQLPARFALQARKLRVLVP
jgi:YegS/Rv2252/BmrU family lipid kinase